MIELRSDTFTAPTDEMRGVIAAAEVGDDVWGEDPTVRRLQEEAARLIGKEAGLFVPSGSMANLISLLVHTRPGDLVILGRGSHCITYESGAGAAVAGVMFHVLGEDGLFTADQVQAAVPPDDVHFSPATLVWLENTHNVGSGRIFPQPDVEAIAAVARDRGMAIHLDGARLLNAAVASGRPASELAAPLDSTSICLSKGLGAPVGSVLVGTADFIRRAHRFRKMLGGAMRQVGILAAAGLYALQNNIDRLALDHDNARIFASGVAGAPGIELDPEAVQTNIVIFRIDHPRLDAAGLIEACAARGTLLCPVGSDRIRAVTHMGVSREQCTAAARTIVSILS